MHVPNLIQTWETGRFGFSHQGTNLTLILSLFSTKTLCCKVNYLDISIPILGPLGCMPNYARLL